MAGSNDIDCAGWTFVVRSLIKKELTKFLQVYREIYSAHSLDCEKNNKFIQTSTKSNENSKLFIFLFKMFSICMK